MEQYISKSALVAEIKKRIDEHNSLANAAADNNLHNTLEANELLIRNYKNLMSFLDTLEAKEVQEEPVSNDLEKAAYQFANCFENHFALASMSFIKGAKWQKEQLITKAIDMTVGYWMPNGLRLDVDETENPYNIDEGNKVKLIIIKDE